MGRSVFWEVGEREILAVFKELKHNIRLDMLGIKCIDIISYKSSEVIILKIKVYGR